MFLLRFLNYAKFSLNAVSETFAPSPGSTKREVRINGAICILVGFLFLAAGLGITFIFKSPAIALKILLIPALFFYSSIIVGGYRLVFGVNAKSSPYEVMSLSRVIFGVAWVLLVLGVPLFVLALVGS